MFASNQGDIKMRDPFDDDCLLDDTFFGCQQQHRQWSAMPGDNIHSSASAETCYMQHCHVDIMQPRLWEGASEAPSMAHEEAYTNSMARQLAHVQDNAFQLENHQVCSWTRSMMMNAYNTINILNLIPFVHVHSQSINARDDMDNYEANNDLLMVSRGTGMEIVFYRRIVAHLLPSLQQSTSTLPIAGAVGSDPQLVTSSESHREATPTSYRWRSPPQITQQSVHFAGQAQSSHYYYKRSEVPHPYTPFPSLLPPHYHFHRQQPEVEQHHESSDDCETFLPRAPWSFPNAHSESNERSKAFATEEQQMLRTPSISCMPPMVPIASVVSADTQDRHASFSDHTSPPLIAHNHHDHHPAGRIVQTPEGPALLLLAAHMPSQVVRPFLVLHQPRTTASTTPTATKATATTKRRFQRWTDAEDEILRDACSKEPGPPFNWIRIASQYFHNERSPTQCKSRWGKVSRDFFQNVFCCKSRLLSLTC